MRDLYIYYQVREADAPALLPRVSAMQAALAREHGVAGQIKRRPEAAQGLQTWMEVYPATGEGFGAALAAAVEQAALPALIAGARHVEVFMDMPPCA
ncbi:DUF4936 family protein [Duganella sp. LX20W]|uniref:DUF4936 family protein n=1 Tax=Rugamonas brunnea TaxID=2758569 RepID=A0A7W2EU74_9BURK|nr:DUF4936 family protein [Rugamonas brunnea]MBA5638706.1 DUF4936 family protein [Rugamonas brunnea]